ncbi:hypothetical protein FSC37_15980 [Piscinibacter aquaticus]|uniref:TniQ domain-containing protein n=1 Tax=Piscinibacter aquaticus TaxID=392597 RepID=A0A5C6U1J9_9BURK|nr:hypothetical protein FSC37_15980 [Piscinibacter aquaticus]
MRRGLAIPMANLIPCSRSQLHHRYRSRLSHSFFWDRSNLLTSKLYCMMHLSMRPWQPPCKSISHARWRAPEYRRSFSLYTTNHQFPLPGQITSGQRSGNHFHQAQARFRGLWFRTPQKPSAGWRRHPRVCCSVATRRSEMATHTLQQPSTGRPNADLFAAWFPTWIPGETLYGVCARYHRIAGSALSSETCLRLFGHPRAGLAHDLTGRIATLAERTSALLGTPEQILLGHTVLGYYLYLREPALRRRLIDELSHQSPRALKSRLGWLASGLGAAHPLKACEECGREDEKQGRCPTWYLVHQLPGVWLCPTHRRPLWVTRWKVNGLHRFSGCSLTTSLKTAGCTSTCQAPQTQYRRPRRSP